MCTDVGASLLARRNDYPRGIDYLRAAQSGDGDIGGNAVSFLTSFQGL